MPIPCPGCGGRVAAGPDAWLPRCPACQRRIRSRLIEAQGSTRVYELELVGRPETRTVLEVSWDAADERRLFRWLFWSSVVTLGLVVVLFALARWAG